MDPERLTLPELQCGAETMFPQYQDTMLKMKPNPPLSVIEKQEQQVISAEE